jgi:tetratricopeptide (TPR) repeat protein
VKLEPDNGAAQLGLGLAHQELGDHAAAARALGLAARLLPQKVAPLLPLARSLLALDRQQEAYAVGVKALALAPGDPEVQWLMAPLYLSRGLHLAAAELVEKLRATRSHDAQYWRVAGQVHSALGRFADARQDFARALTLQPRDPRLVRQVAIAARRAGDYKTARRHLLAVLKLDPQDYDIAVHLAIAEAHLGQGAAAWARLAALVRAHPGRPEAQVYVGWLALRKNALAEAIRWARQADRLAGGKSAHALDVLAQALVRQGQSTQARQVVARALALPLSAEDRAYFVKLEELARRAAPRPGPAHPRPGPARPRPRSPAPRPPVPRK